MLNVFIPDFFEWIQNVNFESFCNRFEDVWITRRKKGWKRSSVCCLTDVDIPPEKRKGVKDFQKIGF